LRPYSLTGAPRRFRHDGLIGVRVKTQAELRHALDICDVIPVAVMSFGGAIEAPSWSALIDARMRRARCRKGNAGMRR
jgi:hypothetical protein